MFSWIVKRLNQAIEVRRDESKEQGRNTVIGVLDIYGFEIFNNNRCVRACVRACVALARCVRVSASCASFVRFQHLQLHVQVRVAPVRLVCIFMQLVSYVNETHYWCVFLLLFWLAKRQVHVVVV